MEASKSAPGRWYYLLAVLVVVAGVGVSLLLLNGIFYKSLEGFVRVSVPEGGDVGNLTGNYSVFYEYQGKVGPKEYSTDPGLKLDNLQCVLRGQWSGDEVEMRRSSLPLSYRSQQSSGVLVFEFSVQTQDMYRLSAEYTGTGQEPEVMLAIGRLFHGDYLRELVQWLAVLVASLVAGLLIARVTYVKRRAAKQRTTVQDETASPQD